VIVVKKPFILRSVITVVLTGINGQCTTRHGERITHLRKNNGNKSNDIRR
jgi:hypothetical protein